MPRCPIFSRFCLQHPKRPPTTFYKIGLTQQASVRRGPCASVPYLLNKIGLTQQASVRRGPCASVPYLLNKIGLTQQASVRRGRASVPYLLTVLLAASKASAFFPNGVCVSSIKVYNFLSEIAKKRYYLLVISEVVSF